jgi:hypothetical protein
MYSGAGMPPVRLEAPLSAEAVPPDDAPPALEGAPPGAAPPVPVAGGAAPAFVEPPPPRFPCGDDVLPPVSAESPADPVL